MTPLYPLSSVTSINVVAFGMRALYRSLSRSIYIFQRAYNHRQASEWNYGKDVLCERI